jgi:hypothetical protein
MDATHSSLGPLQVIANVGHNKLGAARSSLAGKALLTLPLPEPATIRHQGRGNLRLRETILESAPSYVLCRWLTQEPSGDKRGDRTHEGLESKVPLVDTVDQLAVPVKKAATIERFFQDEDSNGEVYSASLYEDMD